MQTSHHPHARLPPKPTHLSEESIAATIDAASESKTCSRQIIDWLPRNHPIYRGRSTNEVMRIRGYLFHSFVSIGLPEKALPFLLEELETGRNAYVIAGVAIGLRGLGEPRMQLLPYLKKAMRNILLTDDALSFESYKPKWPLQYYTTAMAELLRTMSWMGVYARPALPYLQQLQNDPNIGSKAGEILPEAIRVITQDKREPTPACCVSPFAMPSHRPQGRHSRKVWRKKIARIVFEDQDERPVVYEDFFAKKPTVVVFFYTRCDNPNKCSLTLTRLGQLQTAIRDAGLEGLVRTAAITYDPVYDLPFRINSYAKARSVRLDDDNRVLRAIDSTSLVTEYFDSSVNYIGTIVNQHGTELFVLNADGSIRKRFLHLQCEPAQVVDELQSALKDKGNDAGKNGGNLLGGFSSPILSWLTIIAPKCPFCYAAYMSFLGIGNLALIKMTIWLIPVFIILLCVHLWSLYKAGGQRNGDLPFYLSATGILCLILGLWASFPTACYIGFTAILVANLLNSLPHSIYNKLTVKMIQLSSKLKYSFNGQSKNRR